MNSRTRVIATSLLIFAVLMYGLFLVWKWGVTRNYVAHDEVLLVSNKFGEKLPDHLVVVPPEDVERYKGIREDVLGPGRYFINPVFYDTQKLKTTTIRAGEPDKWQFAADGRLVNPETAPQIGLVTRKQGAPSPGGAEVVDAGFKGIQKEVLTPGTYKLNPFLYEIKEFPAVVIPPGSCGVVTRLFGESAEVVSATLSEIAAVTTAPSTNPSHQPAPDKKIPTRLVAGENQRGVLRDVLQPGIYYLNPRQYKVDILPIGYDAITLEHPTRPGEQNTSVRFLSADGYQVEADFTVVWGIAPADAPTIIANIGGWDVIERNVMRQAMISACQNEGSKYTAKELIQGSSRSKFQDDLSASMEKQVASRNIHVLLALIRNIAVKDATGQDQTEGLLATIQRANVEVERQITNRQKTETEKKRAELEQANKLVDVARETVASETKVKVANILAEGQKKAAEIDAQRELTIASVQLEISALEAQTTQILGKAGADVDRLKNEAEAKGAKLLIDAFGSPQAYNSYIFAKNFQPTDLRLIFAGPGTFWTDLKSFQEIGATKMIEQSQEQQRQQRDPAGSGR
jgi:hypothetical protein